jgi:hypothetical protein
VERTTLLVIGSLILAGGLLLASIGGHKVMTNLPVSEETALKEANRELPDSQGEDAQPGGRSTGESVEVEIWKSVQEAVNEVRKSKRTEGIVFIISGIASALWGLAILYNSRSTPKP